jgi:hypothetical protein
MGDCKEELYAIANDDIAQDDNESDTETTYEDICQAVKDGKKHSAVLHMLHEYEVTHYDEIDTLDTITDDLWYNVVIPHIDTYGVLDKHDLKVRHMFSEWLYKHSNIGRRICYIMQLKNAIISPPKAVQKDSRA